MASSRVLERVVTVTHKIPTPHAIRAAWELASKRQIRVSAPKTRKRARIAAERDAVLSALHPALDQVFTAFVESALPGLDVRASVTVI